MRDSMATMHSTATERLPRQETFSRTFCRRVVTVPAFLGGALLALLLAPLLYPIALVVDLLGRRNLATVRAIAMVHAYLSCEAVGVAASAWIWIRHRRNRENHCMRRYPQSNRKMADDLQVQDRAP